MTPRRRLSVRTRLALQFAAAVAVLLLLYAGAVFAFTRGALEDQLRARLHEDYEAAEHGFMVFPTPGWVWSPTPPDEDAPEAPWAEIRNPDGSVMLRRPEAPRVPPSASEVYERDHERHGVTFRIRVGRSRGPVERELADLLLLLAACWAPAVGLSFLVGRWFAGRALAPVAAMTARARTIGAERLSERLPGADVDDELGRLAATFNDAFGRLERSFEALRRFTADASHELRTPLAALRSVGEVALRQPPAAEGYRDAIGSMLEEVDRLARLADDLLLLARADADREPRESRPTELGEVARAAVRTLGVLAEEKRQRLVVEARGAASAPADPRLVERAAVNLLHNAIRYSPEGATVSVRTGTVGEEAFLEVEDQGPGIAPEHRTRVFERFYRVDPSRTGRGAGLGLAIAKSGIEAQGGRIELESEPGRGSRFRILLPRAGHASGG